MDKTFTWSQGRSLASAQLTSGTAYYTYDASGLRQSKTIGSDTTWYSWNGSNMTYQQKGSENLYFYYDTNGAPIALRKH